MVDSPKQRIVEQAMIMFVAQGIKSVRMDDIAQQLAVSKRTLYEMFGDKETLLQLAMNRFFALETARNREIASKAGNLLEGMLLVLDEIMKHSDEHQRVMNNLRKFYPSTFERVIAAGVPEWRAMLKKELQLGIEQGLLIDSVNLDLSITMLYYMCGGLVHNAQDIVLPDGVTLRDAFRQVLVNFFRGISTQKGLAVIDNFLERKRMEENNK